ncbi:MAG: hypothetical protein ACLFPX_07250 [Candidatus Omnitrophota bacterium]
MDIFIPTLIVFLLCAAALGLGLLFKRGPLEKRCSSEPDRTCTCGKGECEK